MEDEEVPVQNDSSGALSKLLAQSNAIAAQQPGVGGGRGGLAAAAALLAPTKTGHWSESLSRGLSAEAEQNASDAKLRAQYAQTIMKALMPATVGRSLMDPMTGRVLATDPSVAEERRAKMLELQLRLNENAAGREERIAATAEQREADRASRAEIAEAARAAAAQRAAEALADRQAGREQNADLRRELAAMIAANRPDPAPTLTTVVGPDGKTPVVKDARTDRIIGTAPNKAVRDPLSPTMQKELFEADDLILASKNASQALTRALALNDKAYGGYFANARAKLVSNLGSVAGASTPEADATVEYENLVGGQALDSLKAIFGAAPTEGERKILLELQASADKTPAQRRALLERAQALADRRFKYNSQKAKAIRDGTYTTQGVDLDSLLRDDPPAAPIRPTGPTGLGTNSVQGRVGEVQPNNRGVTKQQNALPNGFSWEK